MASRPPKSRGQSRPPAKARAPRAPAARTASGGELRRHTRYEQSLPVRLFRGSRARGKKKAAAQVAFSAFVQSRDLSVGGVFLHSTFFLRKGLEVEVELDLPESKRTVAARGTVVRVVDYGDESMQGFAIQFEELLDDSEIYLRAFLDQGHIVEFVEEHAKHFLPGLGRSTYPALIEFMVRWQIHEQRRTEGS